MTRRLAGLGGIAPPQPARPRRARPATPGFDQALDNLLRQPGTSKPAASPTEVGELKFSAHATRRLESRGVVLDQAELGRLDEAVKALADRGANESLVLTNDAAYVVGIPQRTVITAMTRSEAVGQIFTQIDSTYVAT